jgi:hypothetical protein
MDIGQLMLPKGLMFMADLFLKIQPPWFQQYLYEGKPNVHSGGNS